MMRTMYDELDRDYKRKMQKTALRIAYTLYAFSVLKRVTLMLLVFFALYVLMVLGAMYKGWDLPDNVTTYVFWCGWVTSTTINMIWNTPIKKRTINQDKE